MSQPLGERMSDEQAWAFVDTLMEPSRKAKAQGYREGKHDGIIIGLIAGTAIGFFASLAGVLF